MTDKPTHMHDVLDGIVAAAVSNALADKTLAENVTKAVMDAIEEYEDERFLTILQETEEVERIGIGKIRSALES